MMIVYRGGKESENMSPSDWHKLNSLKHFYTESFVLYIFNGHF